MADNLESSNLEAKPTVTFLGNSYDLTALVGVTVGVVVLFSCATCNYGTLCLPFVPIILGAIGLVSVKDSVNPERTKLLSWLSLGAGGAIILLIILLISLYVLIMVFMVASEGTSFFPRF